ncbi:MAG: DUF3394 domain-containing protein, partial [Rhodobacteraceae bacterium]|nr:DUF3394 domain-containing protein [Paracoccaceae bacterium]
FIFNTDLLLIDVDWFHGIFVFIVATVAMLLFAAATQGWFLARNRIYESVLLLLVAFTLFRPGFWMDMVAPPFVSLPPAQIEQAMADASVGDDLRLTVNGLNSVGDPITFTALVPVADGATGADRLLASGIEYVERDNKIIIDNVAFDSPAQKAGLDWDQEIVDVLAPVSQPTKYLMFLPALLVLALVVMLQRRRVAPLSAAA